MKEIVKAIKIKKVKKEQQFTDSELIDIIVNAMDDKKASNIILMNLNKLEKSVCNAFVICNADSGTQVRAIADNVQEETIKQLNVNAWRRQGDENALWIILDYGTVVVHVFRTEAREYYSLESLWADAEIELNRQKLTVNGQ
jgi:ribosome-associated protein